jgi:2,4'-dihydroxyacetophenone dioxygenase
VVGALTLVRVVGANINFTTDGQFHSILDAALLRHRTGTLAFELGGGFINSLGGGDAAMTAKDA